MLIFTQNGNAWAKNTKSLLEALKYFKSAEKFNFANTGSKIDVWLTSFNTTSNLKAYVFVQNVIWRTRFLH